MLPALRAGARSLQVILLLVSSSALAESTLARLTRGAPLDRKGTVAQCKKEKEPAACWMAGRGPTPKGLAILRAGTNSLSFRLVIAAEGDVKGLQYFFLSDEAQPKMVPLKRRDFAAPPGELGSLVELTAEELPRTRSFRFLAFDTKDAFVDGRMIPMPVPTNTARFAMAACADDNYDGSAMWIDLLEQRPDFLLLLGDNTYADFVSGVRGVATNPAILWRRNRETRLKLSVFRGETLLPAYAIWDDHDYGKNDGDETFRWRKESEEIFRQFFGRVAPVTVGEGPGISESFDWGPQRFVLTDGRSFRNDKEHWGLPQEDWAMAELNAAPGIAWLAQGDQFFGKYHRFESFEKKHPEAFARLFSKLATVSAPVFLLSGDRHLVELMKLEPSLLGYGSYELTSSAIHAKTYPDSWAKDKNPRQIAGASGVWNYAIVESRVEGRKAKGWIEARGPERKVLFREEFSLGK